jgi:succinoglycan biosynthesis transport protein ExoP
MTDKMAIGGPGDGYFSAPPSAGSEPTLLRIVLRQKWKILVFALGMTGIAFLIVRSLPQTYSSAASVALDARKMQLLATANVLSTPQLDLDRLRTEMEGFHSPAIAEAVVNQLDLTHTPAFCDVPRSGLSNAFAALTGPASSSAPSPACASVEAAAKHLGTMVSVSNDSRSYIVRVQADAVDPKLAADIANAYADGYVDNQRNSNSADVEQADAWLATYLSKLRAQTQEADTAVARYLQQHQLTPLRGETIVGQSLGELNSQLSIATGDLTQKQSMLRQVQGLAASGGRLDASAQALDSPIIQSLLEKLALQMAAQADLQSRFGPAHPQVRAGAAQIAQIQQQIRAEVGKTVAALNGEVAALTARRASLLARVQGLQGEAAQQNQEDVRLQQLQRDADADRQLYQTMLVRLKEIDAEQGMQLAGVHVVVAARPADVPSFPRTKMILVGSFLTALGAGAGIAVGGSFLSRRFRDVDQIEGETGLPVLGLFPRPARRISPHDVVIDQPMSLETESLQAIMIGLSQRKSGHASPNGQVLMVVSALPGEGKTSFVLALGRAAANASLSVALVDCDMRQPSLRRLIVKADDKAKLKRPTPAQPVWTTKPGWEAATLDRRSGVHMIPISSFVRNPHELLAPRRMAEVLGRLRADYDLIILDTPPILAVPDAVALAPLADEVLLLTSWRETSRSALNAAIDRLRRSAVDISGIVITKADLRDFAQKGQGSRYYATGFSGYTSPARVDA